MPTPRIRQIVDSGGRVRFVEYRPELLNQDYESPRTNIALVLRNHAEVLQDLRRRL